MKKSLLGMAAIAAICGALTGTQALAQGLKVDVLSSRPDLVTGGDALVKITGGTGTPTVSVGGKDVTAAFKADPKGGWVGLVTGLVDGPNTLAAKSGDMNATATLTNHPLNGTLFAGPQQTPFVCENESFNLAPAKDASCAAPTVVTYYVKNKAGDYKPWDPATPKPTDVATTKTTDGKSVPFIVRQERGVINRAAYVINILHDPSAGPLPTPTDRGGSAWNGKIVYGFGPGVGNGYHMGRNYGHFAGPLFIESSSRDFDAPIAGGYATMSSSLNVFGTMPNDVLSAESLAKVKEHFIEEFGVPTYTIGQGTSGGSMQQNLIANAYPGLLDAITPNQLFPDTMTFLQPLYDCELLVNVFKQGTWTRDQMQAVAGKYWGYCVSNGTRYPSARATSCDAAVTDAVEKDPVLKAKGVRCDFQDNLVNVFGLDPATGFARNPFDNVGIQYGLKALNAGKITMDQFIDINARIGGHDVNGKIVAARQVGDELAIKRSYETGRVNGVTGGYAEVPIVGTCTYIDGEPFGRGDPNVDVHDMYHTDILQARLQKNGLNNFVYLLAATGNTATPIQVIGQTTGQGTVLYNNTPGSPTGVIGLEALTQLDKWLTAIANDKSDRSKAQKVAANKPADFVSACYAARGGFDMTGIEKITDMAKCKQIFPGSTGPREAAGGPVTEDVFKCQLKPIDVKDYKTAPTADQMAALTKAFPGGVCDYSKPGIGQTAQVLTWLKYEGDGKYAQLPPVR